MPGTPPDVATPARPAMPPSMPPMTPKISVATRSTPKICSQAPRARSRERVSAANTPMSSIT